MIFLTIEYLIFKKQTTNILLNLTSAGKGNFFNRQLTNKTKLRDIHQKFIFSRDENLRKKKGKNDTRKQDFFEQICNQNNKVVVPLCHEIFKLILYIQKKN